MSRIWLNGAILDAAAARIDPADRGFTLGDGLFETLRLKAGRPLRFAAHHARLAAGAALLRLPLPLDAADLDHAVIDTAAANGLADAAVRLTLSRGPGPRGVLPPAAPQPTLLIAAAPYARPPAACTAVVATVTRRNEHSPLSRLKTLNYLDLVLARQEAAERGADEAILLNTAGRVAEASIANVFALLDGCAVTPPPEEGALPGVLRAAALAEAAGAERPLTVDDLLRAEAVFLTNSQGIRRVSALDGRPVGSAEGAAWVERLAAAFD
ncbi:MAG TPA: aminotransferase class IV [Alphaproteobacteria bacterium]|nr:aminotransferase class IV [Alphaproteobacteria bacterium]